MTIEQRLQILDNRFAECRETFTAKGKSYAGNDDALFNFKQVAQMTGQTVFQVWASYFMKHVLSLTNAVKDNPSNPVDKSEGNDGRVTDVINYAVLFECLAKEVHPLLQTPSPELVEAVIKDFEKTLKDDLVSFDKYIAEELSVKEIKKDVHK